MSWILKECGEVSYYQSQTLNDSSLVQAFSTRKAGNMAFHTGDDANEVKKRHHRFLQCLGLEEKSLIAARQVHGTRVAVVDYHTAGRGASCVQDLIPDTDALITRERGLVLSIFTADCLPIFIYDPQTPAIGIVHAGWRGTLDRIAAKTIEKMTEQFGTNPGLCRAGIAPAICGECFQVSESLADNFSKEFPETVRQTDVGFYVDLALFNTKVFETAGLPVSVIDYSQRCTVCRPDEFFSYRASRSPGRMMGVIALR